MTLQEIIFRILTEPTIKVDTKTPAIVGQTVVFTMTLLRFPLTIPLPMCRIFYGNGKQSELVRVKRYQSEAIFYFPGKYEYKSKCRLGEHEFRASGDILVEADLEHPPLSLQFTETNATYLFDVELRFSHIYSFPVYYHLTIGDVAFTYQLTSFDRDLFTQKSLTSQSFALTREHQKRLGPGKHSFVIVLANNVSTLVLSDAFCLVEPISDLGVEVANFVGIHPYTSDIEVTTSAGAPMSATLNILDYSTNKSVAKFNSVYSYRCPLWHVTTSLPKSTTQYLIEVTARNRASPLVVAYSTVIATPLVYDVFVSSKNGFVVGRDEQMLLYIRGNIGKYKMSVDVDNHKRSDHSLMITKSTQTFFPQINFPMDPRDYTMVTMPTKFESSGEKMVAIKVENQLISLNFKQIVLAQYKNDCDVTVRIRDGNVRNWLETALYIEHFLHLTADTFFHCSAVTIPSYKWEIFRVKSKDETPVLKNRLNLNLDETEPNIYADARLFALGLYVAKLSLTVHDQRHWQATGYHQDSTLFQVGQPTPDVMIQGGTRREVGEV